MADRSDKGCFLVVAGSLLAVFGCCGGIVLFDVIMMAEHQDPKTGQVVGAGFQPFQAMPLAVTAAAFVIGLTLLVFGLRENRS